MEVVKAIWITMTAFFLVIGVIAMIVAWAGTPFGGALLASVGAVSNIGQIYDFVRPEHFPNAPTYAGMTATGQLALCLGMIFGRFEILSMLTLFLTLFWRD